MKIIFSISSEENACCLKIALVQSHSIWRFQRQEQLVYFYIFY